MSSARCLFISDLHLDQRTLRLNLGLERFLRAEAAAYDEIYILGDLVEVWVGDDDDSPFATFLRTILGNAARHCDLYLMHGNRDFLFGPRFAVETGSRLMHDPAVIDCNGLRVLLSHGDAYCTRDTVYQQMRAMLRSAEWQADILSRGLEERHALARALRAQSATANANKPENIMDVTPSAIEAAIEQHRVDLMVHGHTHRPGIHVHDVANRRIRRFVLGDWARCGWALRADAGEFRLVRFNLPADAQ
jgi:UDP-2,3-diacylglucosamine hydrolase